LPGAIRAFGSKGKGPSSRGAHAFFRKVNRRFLSKDELNPVRSSDELVARIIRAYRQYYRDALLDLSRKDSFERALEERVRDIAKDCGLRIKERHSWASVEALLTKEFLRRGYRALFGRVTPFRSLLVWKRERTRIFIVPLMSGPQRVKVVLLDEFVELGWLHYATFGRYYVGGWAKKSALYCVSRAYKHNFRSEAFRVSYLAHEAQHYSDYKSFPGLTQSDLEYRAKLAELIASKRPKRLMRKFVAEARNDPKFPHCHAAFRILRDLGTGTRGPEISLRARQCLADHSARLASGA
jgi:hypothetical protein